MLFAQNTLENFGVETKTDFKNNIYILTIVAFRAIYLSSYVTINAAPADNVFLTYFLNSFQLLNLNRSVLNL